MPIGICNVLLVRVFRDKCETIADETETNAEKFWTKTRQMRTERDKCGRTQNGPKKE